MSEYKSWKAGDPKIKPAPLKVKPKTWTLLTFDEGNVITPKGSGTAIWGFYINVEDAAGAKTMKLRWIREPNGIKDFTGQRTLDLELSNIHSDLWMFNAKAGQPVGIEVYHAGVSDMTIITRECKMWIPV
jgi:hypothetical protein